MKKKAISRSEVMKLAHQLKVQGYPFGLSQRKAWVVGKAKRKMSEELVELTFDKKDGTRTTRIGTLNEQLVPSGQIIYSRPDHPLQTIFWSFTDNDYRSFLAQNLVAIKALRED